MDKRDVIAFLKRHEHVLTEEEYQSILFHLPCVRHIIQLGDGLYCFEFDDFTQVQFYVCRPARTGRGPGEPQSQT